MKAARTAKRHGSHGYAEVVVPGIKDFNILMRGQLSSAHQKNCSYNPAQGPQYNCQCCGPIIIPGIVTVSCTSHILHQNFRAETMREPVGLSCWPTTVCKVIQGRSGALQGYPI